MSHTFICLPTLELTTFEQQVCTTKIGYANALLLGTDSRKKKECRHFGQRTSSKKSTATFKVVGLNEKRAVYIASSKFSKYSRTATELIPLLQPEQGFFRKDGPERFQLQDWYPNEKMVVISVCLNARCFDVGCCSSECMGVVSH